jgi:hypothetical protein
MRQEEGEGVIDRKFELRAHNPVNGRSYTERSAFVFLAKDAAVPAALEAYIGECAKLGANPEHLQSVRLLLERVRHFQSTVKHRVPDTVGAEIARCIDGVGVK